MRKYKPVFWGIMLLLAAGLLLANQFGLISPIISIWKLVIALFLASILIEGIVHFEFFGILMPLAGIFLLFSNSFTTLSPNIWPVLIAALLASIGLDIIFRKPIRNYRIKHGQEHHDWHNYHSEYANAHETVENLNDNNVNCSLSFGSGIKYLHADSLKNASFGCSFGSLKVYFDQCKLSEEGADIRVDCAFSSIIFYIPQTWKVHEGVTTSLGALKSRENKYANDENVIRLTGSVAFGALEIVYV